jgi:hypothetical protein
MIIPLDPPGEYSPSVVVAAAASAVLTLYAITQPRVVLLQLPPMLALAVTLV